VADKKETDVWKVFSDCVLILCDERCVCLKEFCRGMNSRM
jgi:hypothetical protein